MAAPPATKSTIGLRVRPPPRSRRCGPLQQAAGTGVQDVSGKVDPVGRPAAAGPGHRRRGFDRHYLGRALAGAQGLSPPGGAGRAYALPASVGLASAGLVAIDVGSIDARARAFQESQKSRI